MEDKKRAIKVSTLDELAEGFQESRGITDKLTMKQMIAFAKEPVGGGENKLAPFIDRSITEITEEDLEGLTSIGNYAFANCINLVDVAIPNTITSIGEQSFAYCSNLPTITLPNSIITIGQNAFRSCTSFTTITIPNSVTSIEDYAFGYCENLTSVTLSSSIKVLRNRMFMDCKNLTTVILPYGIEELEAAFWNCQKLTSITIPSSVNKINSGVFSYVATTSNKATITMLGTIPPAIQADTFKTDRLNKIIVPKGYVDIYKSATNWSIVADYIEEAAE